MKPNFALSLAFDGIRLLHRAAGGWRLVGEADPQASDLTAQLSTLRKTATSLEPAGMRTKVMIPNDQVKYLTIDSTGLSEEARVQAARVALEGATPYAVDDLAFDICADGSKTHIAAVARETLHEAEAFANEHRFYPVSCVSVPGKEAFLGEPFFGPTVVSETLLEDGEQVEPDGIAVVVTGAIAAPDLSVKEEFAVVEEPLAVEIPEPTAPEPIVSEASPIEAQPEATQVAPAELISDEQTKEDNEDLLDAAMASFKPSPEDPIEESVPTTNTNAPSVPLSSDEPEEKPAPSAAFSAFTSRRNAAATAEKHTEKRVDVNAPVAPLATDLPEPTPVLSAPIPSEPLPEMVVAAPMIAPETAAKVTPRKGLLDRFKAATPARPQTLKPALMQSAPPTPGQTVISAQASEAERMTVFGARAGAEIGGKPRFLGLMLTAALLIFLAGVAAWASVFLDDGLSLSRLFGDRSARVSASAPTTSTSDGQILPNPAAREQEGETVRTAALDPGLSDEDGAVLDALRAPVAAPDEPLTPQEAEANYAVTGYWPIAPNVPPAPATQIDIEDLYLTSIDPINITTDAIALPPSDSFVLDQPILDTPLTATPGIRFALDSRGMVIPSPEGAPSPEGFTVFLGNPPLVPPSTPNRAVTQVTPEPSIAPNPLLQFRPKTRPSDLAERTERSLLGGLTRNELADYRPTLRPASIQQQAEAASAAAAATAIQAANAAEAAEAAASIDTSDAVQAALASVEAEQQANPFLSATKLATGASQRPDTRPRNFARIVKRATRAEPQETQVASAASIAPRTVSPKIPSKTSVARQATVKNAINLRKVNLIGVYGKPSSRRALVRLGNGRYRKVEVGDRIDGGRVSAIGDNELRYTKGGRNLILKMPRS